METLKYYVFEITTYLDPETKDKYAVSAYDTLDSANGMFHTKMAAALKETSGVKTELCMVIDGHGNTQRYEYWESSANATPTNIEGE